MRRNKIIMAALLGGSAGLLLSAGSASAQVNGNWSLPNSTSTPPNNDSGTSPTAEADGNNTVGDATGWYMSPAPNPDFGYTNGGMRDTFYSVEPSSSGPPVTGWSFWLQTFTQSGFASQSVAATAGTNYTFTSQFSFQDGSGPGNGYNAVTLANQTEASPVSPNSGDLFSYVEIKYENSTGGLTGSDITKIAAGSVSAQNIASGPGAGSTAFAPYTVSGTAPANTTQAQLLIGWNNGGLDGGTGGQSAFADDEVFAPTAVPEPASISLLSLGGIALMARRRRKMA